MTYIKLVTVLFLMLLALIICSCQNQEPQGIIVEKRAGFDVSNYSLAQKDIGDWPPPVPGSPEYDELGEYAIVAIVTNDGRTGTITVVAELAVEGCKTQTDAKRLYLKHNEEKGVYFEFISRKGLKHTPRIWCSNSLEDYERYKFSY